MSHLIAVAYEDLGTARNILGELMELTLERVISIDDAAIVEHRLDGKMKLHQTARADGTVGGDLIGVVFLAPFLRAAAGEAAGGMTGTALDVGVDDSFMTDLGEDLEPGAAAVIVLVRASSPDKILPRISRYGGRVIHSSLSQDAEARLNDALSVAVR